MCSTLSKPRYRPGEPIKARGSDPREHETANVGTRCSPVGGEVGGCSRVLVIASLIAWRFIVMSTRMSGVLMNSETPFADTRAKQLLYMLINGSEKTRVFSQSFFFNTYTVDSVIMWVTFSSIHSLKKLPQSYIFDNVR